MRLLPPWRIVSGLLPGSRVNTQLLNGSPPSALITSNVRLALKPTWLPKRIVSRNLKRPIKKKEVVLELLELRRKLRPDLAAVTGKDGEPKTEEIKTEDRATLLAKLGELEKELAVIQGEDPLIFPSVDEQAVASWWRIGPVFLWVAW